MSHVQTDLIGRYVKIPSEGDAGWIRAVYAYTTHLLVAVQRDNQARDLKVYFASLIIFPEATE